MNVTSVEAQLAKYRESSARADDTIDAQTQCISAQSQTIETQREIITLLHSEIDRLERLLAEVRAAL